MARKRYMIIGDGAAGLTAAEELRRRDGEAAIGLFCDDPNPGYFRAALTNFLLGELREDQLWAVPPDFYGKRGIERVFTRVLRVDPAAQKVWCSGNPVPLGFDALLVATGARARPPTFAGSHLPGVLTLRTIQDARRVVDTLRAEVKRAVVLGGGPLGLEWTHALLERGVHVTLLERAPRFMPRALDAVASDLLAARLRKAGVEIVLGEEVTRVDPGPHGGVASLMTNTGRRLACDLVASALGIVPNSELLESSGIVREPNGAVKVDKRLQSSSPMIWAAGDVASVEGEQLGLWEPARHQGRVAAANMAGGDEQYRPGVHYLATRLFDLDFARIGEIEDAPGCTALVDFPRGTGHIAYRKLSLKDGKVRGALLIGERQAKVRAIGRGLKRLIDAGADVSAVAQRLLDPGFDVSGFLETRKLVAPPEAKRTEMRAMSAAAAPLAAAAAAPAVSAAKLRGTQAISLSTLAIPSGAFPAQQSQQAQPAQPAKHSTSQLPQRTSQLPVAQPGTSQLPQRTSLIPVSEPRHTKMLSIGFHAEAPPPPAAPEEPIEARFEIAGQPLRIEGKLCGIGSGKGSTVWLASDPHVAFLHAQITQQGRELYLRDAGTQTGTWVNGVPLAGAHSLRDGDRVVVGRTELIFRSSMLAPSTAAAEAVIALPRLELRSGPGMGLSFVLAAERCSIGSGAGVDFQIFDPSIAPLHAWVRAVQGAHYLSDPGSPSGSYARGHRLAPGQEVPLGDGETFQLGAITLAYSRAPTKDRVAAFRPMARLSVTSGPSVGASASFAERLLVGSAPSAQGAAVVLAMPGTLAHELELVAHQGAYFARDLSGGRTFKSGTPLGPEWAPLKSGELLLVSTGAMVRFEEP